MKRDFLTLIALIAITITALAQATQPCIVKQYNQKQLKTPLPGVQVEVRDAGSATSDKAGLFTLKFATLKPGDRVPFRAATKTGFELMNKMAVEQWNIARDQKTFEIVLVKSDYFNQLKNNLKQASIDSYHQKYEQTRKQLEKLQKEGKLKEQEFYQKLNDLEDHYDNQLKNLDSYIDQFARIDLSELSEQEQQFIELAHAGHLDEAAEAYVTLNAAGKYATAVENIHQLTRDIEKLETEKARQQETADALFTMLQRQVATMKLAGGEENFRKAGELLKRAAMADTTNINVVWDYAYFAYSQKNFKEAERFYLICLNGSKDNILQATLQNNLGNLYISLHNYAKAEESYLKALEDYTLLFSKNPDAYHTFLAKTQNNLGTLYSDLNNYPKAEEYYLKALENYTQLFSMPPDAYRPDLATTQNNMGNLYYKLHEYAKAEEYRLKALDNYTILFNLDPDAYRADLALAQNNIGGLYHALHDYTKVEEYYLKALENYTILFSQNPDAYRSYLAGTQSNLGILLYHLHEYAKAEEYQLKALENRTQLFNQNPDAYREDLALTLNNLGLLYSNLHNYAKAEDNYLKALNNYTHLFCQNTDAYRDDLAGTQNNMGNLYYNLHDYAKAEEYYLKALENRTLLFNQDPNAYRPDLAMTQNNLGLLYNDLYDYVKAEEYYLRALENLTLLFSQDPNAYRSDLATTQNNLGTLYRDLHDYVKAEEYYLKALENKTLLFNLNPDAYQPSLATTQDNIGVLYSAIHDYTKAEEYHLKALENYIQLFNKNPDAYHADLARTQYNLGLLYSNLNEYTKAKEYYLKAMENYTHLFNQNPDAYRADLVMTQHNLGLLYFNLDDYDKVEEYYIQAMQNYNVLFKTQPDKYRDKLAWIQFCLMYVYERDNSKSEQYDMMLTNALANYTILYKEDDMYKPILVELKNRRGQLFLTNGKNDEALQLFEDAYKLSPEESKPFLAAGYNSKAYEYANASNYGKALETIDRAIALIPGEANFYDSKGEILLMKGDEQGALKMWQKVQQLSPEFLQEYEGYSNLYKQLKEKGLITE